MIELFLIGIGTGNPDHLTVQASKAIAAADLILVPLKGEDKADLADLRYQICQGCMINPAARIETFDLPSRNPDTADYLTRVIDWHDEIAQIWSARITAHLQAGGGQRVALLVWGDPSLYDSTLRIADRVARHLPLRRTVIPGITSIQALCAAHAIPLNALAAPVVITTGRTLRDHGWPEAADTIVVMLDGGCAFAQMGLNEAQIWWGAYLGLPQQVLITGRVGDVAEQIIATRAQARASHGWIMDTYLLRR
ncbi:MAG: precorrin-6A synthase (deacetylating) [Rhodobacteraceae bacterium]|nr:precorrin-6A synthase (deacetylating) [Paracoccaceae bacterium]